MKTRHILICCIAAGVVSTTFNHCSNAPTSAESSSWKPDRHLVALTFYEALNQYTDLPTKGAVASLTTFRLSNRDTTNYLKRNFDRYGNELSRMDYLQGDQNPVPVTDYTAYRYNDDSTKAWEEMIRLIDNSVNYAPKVYTSIYSKYFTYNGYKNITAYAYLLYSDSTFHQVRYFKNKETLVRIDSTDTCIYDLDGGLKELHAPYDKFVFNDRGLVSVQYRYKIDGSNALTDTRTFNYDNEGNVVYISSDQPGTAWSETNHHYHYSYSFDSMRNWIEQTCRHIEWDNGSQGIDTLSDETFVTYRIIEYF